MYWDVRMSRMIMQPKIYVTHGFEQDKCASMVDDNLWCQLPAQIVVDDNLWCEVLQHFVQGRQFCGATSAFYTSYFRSIV